MTGQYIKLCKRSLVITEFCPESWEKDPLVFKTFRNDRFRDSIALVVEMTFLISAE